jgi:alkane 1-monooxygenase
MRRYQALRHFDELPALPGGYSLMFLLAYVPSLWFRVTNPRVLALAGGLSRVNTGPAHALAAAA